MLPNLMGNGVEFGDAGEVALEVEKLATSAPPVDGHLAATET